MQLRRADIQTQYSLHAPEVNQYTRATISPPSQEEERPEDEDHEQGEAEEEDNTEEKDKEDTKQSSGGTNEDKEG